jgi:anti-sigma factor RsiW
MTTCDPMALSAWIDNELPRAAADRLRQHVTECPSCASEARENRELKALFARRSAALVIPLGLDSRVSSALDAAHLTVARPWWKGGAGIASGIAILVTSVGLWFAVPHGSKPLDLQALAWQHRHAMNPPADQSLRTANPENASRWVRDRLGSDSRAPRLALPLNAVGACHIGDNPTAIWMYGSAEPVTVIEIFGRHPLPDWPKNPKRGWSFGPTGGYNAAVWESDGRTYAIVSSLTESQLSSVLEPSP